MSCNADVTGEGGKLREAGRLRLLRRRGHPIRRRELIALLGGAVTCPSGAFAQAPGRTYRIAYLGPSPRNAPPQLAFFETLGKLGFVEGKSLEIDARGFGRRPEQFLQAAEELVQAKPDLILCGGPEPGRAAQQATRTIPLLVNSDDMVGEGLVASIAHPGGNTTGISIRSPTLDGKRFEILLELISAARRVDALAGSDTANEQHFQELREAARAAGSSWSSTRSGPMARLRRRSRRQRPPARRG